MPELLYFRPANETFLISKSQASRVRNVILLSKLYCSRSLALGFFDAFVPSQSPQIFFPVSKISTSTRIHIQIEFALPHVSDTYPDSLQYPGLLWGYWQQSMRHKTLEFCFTFHGKELGSFLFGNGVKKYPDQRPHDSRFIAYSKFLLWRADSKSCGFSYGIHWIRVDGSKSCGFKKVRIRVDGA